MLHPKKNNELGSGCGSVGRAVASNTRSPWFESSHQQIFIQNSCLPIVVNYIEKTQIKKKEAVNGLFKKEILWIGIQPSQLITRGVFATLHYFY